MACRMSNSWPSNSWPSNSWPDGTDPLQIREARTRHLPAKGSVPSGRCEEIGKCTHTVLVTYAVDLYTGMVSTLPDPPLPRLASIDRSQLLLHTVDVERLIGEDHSARSIWHLVGRMNLSLYHAKIAALEGHAGRDHTAPQLLISLWLYGYSQGISSARQIARQCAFGRWAIGGTRYLFAKVFPW
jgi:hypothetical protein